MVLYITIAFLGLAATGFYLGVRTHPDERKRKKDDDDYFDDWD